MSRAHCDQLSIYKDNLFLSQRSPQEDWKIVSFNRRKRKTLRGTKPREQSKASTSQNVKVKMYDANFDKIFKACKLYYQPIGSILITVSGSVGKEMLVTLTGSSASYLGLITQITLNGLGQAQNRPTWSLPILL